MTEGGKREQAARGRAPERWRESSVRSAVRKASRSP